MGISGAERTFVVWAIRVELELGRPSHSNDIDCSRTTNTAPKEVHLCPAGGWAQPLRRRGHKGLPSQSPEALTAPQGAEAQEAEDPPAAGASLSELVGAAGQGAPGLPPAPAGEVPGSPVPHGSAWAARGDRGARTPVPQLRCAGPGSTNALFCLAFALGFSNSCATWRRRPPAGPNWGCRGSQRRWTWRRRRMMPWIWTELW
ncbi:uncharacterized protein LOC133215340 [Neopsephotus bourkii]|uniref:uncharacterized protein LOC133215340 n=1 Tax=Neopsephotus bourkii TaxID=309878 RepID=UPI002AA551DC|nr:uncharacterized protein LOC133215340 [Neopsephotus bourkii]